VKDFNSLQEAISYARKRHPKIRAHREEDFEWNNLGMKALQEGKTILAENFFCKLMLSQPQHADGYRGFADVCLQEGRKNGAVLLMEHALELVRESYKLGETDIEVVEMFDADLQQMKKTIATLRP
jgi:hypothetical protein